MTNNLQAIIEQRIAAKLAPAIEKSIANAIVGSIDKAIDAALASAFGPQMASQTNASIQQNLDDNFGVVAKTPRRGRPPGSKNRATIEREARKAAEEAAFLEARGGKQEPRNDGRQLGEHAPINATNEADKYAPKLPDSEFSHKGLVVPKTDYHKLVNELHKSAPSASKGAIWIANYEKTHGITLDWLVPSDIIWGSRGGVKTKARPSALADWEKGTPKYVDAIVNRAKWVASQKAMQALVSGEWEQARKDSLPVRTLPSTAKKQKTAKKVLA